MSQDQSQPYDRALKSLLGNEVAEILPILLPGSEFVGEQNIEIDRTAIKADLVYNVQYKGNPHVLNMELQTDTDNEVSDPIPLKGMGLRTGVVSARLLHALAEQTQPGRSLVGACSAARGYRATFGAHT